MAIPAHHLTAEKDTSWADFYTGLKASGFHIVFVALIIVLFIEVDQIQDMVQQLDDFDLIGFLYYAVYVFASVYFTLCVWLTSRLIFDIKSYELQNNVTLSLLGYIRGIQAATRTNYFCGKVGAWLPRVLAVVPSLVPFFYALCHGFNGVALITFISAFLIILFLWKRPKEAKRLSIRNCFWLILGLFSITAVAAIFFQPLFIYVFNSLNLIWWGLASMLFGFFLTAYFMFDTLNYLIKRFDFSWFKNAFYKPYPILIPMIILPLIAGSLPTSDNHQVRLIEANNGTDLHPIPTLQQAFTNFKQNSPDKITFEDKTNRVRYIPVFLVGAQGGGLRASYWSALALDRLEEILPGFANNLFLLSGASGGTVGNAFYLASKQVPQPAEKCQLDIPQTTMSLADKTCLLSNALGRDYLSSVATSFMYNDMLYSFLPLPVPVYKKDRATYLEQSFEKGFLKVYGGVDDGKGNSVSALSLGYKSFYLSEQWTPILLGTSTIQETGLMSVYAPFPVKGEVFNNKLDTNKFINSGRPRKWVTENEVPPVMDMRLSTVAVNSARFPYVTPTGTLNVDADRADKFHTADAGYFDNYGAATLLDVMEYLFVKFPMEKGTDGWLNIYVPVPVLLKNDILVDKYRPTDPRSAFDIKQPNISSQTASYFAHELTSPLQALIEIRGGLANTKLAELIAFQQRQTDLKRMLALTNKECVLNKLLPGESPVIAFYYQQLKDDSVKPPLGWWLSSESKQEMLNQIQAFPEAAYSELSQCENYASFNAG